MFYKYIFLLIFIPTALFSQDALTGEVDSVFNPLESNHRIIVMYKNNMQFPIVMYNYNKVFEYEPIPFNQVTLKLNNSLFLGGDLFTPSLKYNLQLTEHLQTYISSQCDSFFLLNGRWNNLWTSSLGVKIYNSRIWSNEINITYSYPYQTELYSMDISQYSMDSTEHFSIELAGSDFSEEALILSDKFSLNIPFNDLFLRIQSGYEMNLQQDLEGMIPLFFSIFHRGTLNYSLNFKTGFLDNKMDFSCGFSVFKGIFMGVLSVDYEQESNLEDSINVSLMTVLT